MTNTVGILPGAATMASSPMIAACRACYAATRYLFCTSASGAAVRRAWRRGDAWEVAFWCAWLHVALANPGDTLSCGQTIRSLSRDLDRTLADLCCVEGIDPLTVWQAVRRPTRRSESARRT